MANRTNIVIGGGPALDHPRRCQAKRKKGPCMRWALKGSSYCQFHGGRRQTEGVKLRTMPMFYSRQLGPTLQASLEAVLDCDPSEQLNLLQELALLRTRAAEAVGIYSALLEKEDASPDSVQLAANLMATCLKDVADMAKTAAAVRASMDDKIDATQLGNFVAQLVRVIHHHLSEQPEVAKQIELDLRQKVRMPTSRGTTITPDMADEEAESMDATIPKPATNGVA